MNNTEENSHQHQSKLNLRICGGEHKVSTLKQVQEVVTPQEELRKEPNRDGKHSVSYRPIGHNLLIDKTRKHLDQAGFTIEGDKPVIRVDWFAVKARLKVYLVKAHSCDAVDAFACCGGVPPCQCSKDQPAYISTDNLVAVQENARAVGASASDL